MPNVQSPNALGTPSWWRENSQAEVLGSGNSLTGTADISPFFANVDFSKLANQVNDETDVPQTGPMNRIMASHFEPEQGVDYSEICSTSANTCIGWLRGRLQPYSIYVPSGPQPADGYGLTLLLHSLGANYNQFPGQQQPVASSASAGRLDRDHSIRPRPDGWYYGVRRLRHVRDVGGHSGALHARSRVDHDQRLLDGRLRDLQARRLSSPTCSPRASRSWVRPGGRLGPAGPAAAGRRAVEHEPDACLVPQRPVPDLERVADELVPVAGAQAQAAEFGSLGLATSGICSRPPTTSRSRSTTSTGEAATFLGTTEVDRNPPHVTYVATRRWTSRPAS